MPGEREKAGNLGRESEAARERARGRETGWVGGAFRKTAQGYWECGKLAELEFLRHSFGTKHGAGLAAERRYTSLRQVHSARWVEAREEGGFVGEGDALITAREGLLIGVRTADCLPILLADPVRRAVAAVHAGWRGTALGIVGKVVTGMGECFGSAPRDLVAAIGPGIGGCCYEVGEEVVQQLREWLPEDTKQERRRVDLAEICALQLVAAGLKEENVVRGAPCTYCKAEDFYSYRRDGQLAGRMVSSIVIVGQHAA